MICGYWICVYIYIYHSCSTYAHAHARICEHVIYTTSTLTIWDRPHLCHQLWYIYARALGLMSFRCFVTFSADRAAFVWLCQGQGRRVWSKTLRWASCTGEGGRKGRAFFDTKRGCDGPLLSIERPPGKAIWCGRNVVFLRFPRATSFLREDWIPLGGVARRPDEAKKSSSRCQRRCMGFALCFGVSWPARCGPSQVSRGTTRWLQPKDLGALENRWARPDADRVCGRGRLGVVARMLRS